MNDALHSLCDPPKPPRKGERGNAKGICCFCKQTLGYYDTKFIEDYTGRLACFAAHELALGRQYDLLLAAGMSDPPGWSVYSDG